MEPSNPNVNVKLTIAEKSELPVVSRVGNAEIFDCWKKIGVHGDGTCQELEEFVHCRNCPVYSAAAAHLLDREPPAGYRRDWTEQFSRAKKRIAPGKMSAVIFRIGSEWLALPTQAFQEVAERRRVHSMPHRQLGIVLGVINIRGELLLCVSLGRLLGIEQEDAAASPRTVYDRLAVTEWQGSLMSFPVQEVYGIHRFHAEELKEIPATVSKANSSFTRGILEWQGKQVGCLNEEVLFSTLNRSLT